MLGEALRLTRTYHNISQTQLSNELAVSNSYLSEIESGKKTPTIEFLTRFGEYFEIPLSSLIFFSETLDKDKVTDKVRVSLARKVLSILQWVEQKKLKTT